MTAEQIINDLADCKVADRYFTSKDGRRYWVFGVTAECILARRCEAGIMKPLCQIEFSNVETIL